ncbi:MAG: folate-binding protein [Rhodanobacter sp.]
MTNLLPAETLLIEGADASSFAHAQFSSAVSSLAVGRWQFSAWLDPKGRVLALFHLVRLADDRYLLLLRGGSAAAIAAALQRFVFRSKLRILALPPRGLATGPALPQGVVVMASSDADSGAEDHAPLSLGCDSHSLNITSSDSGDDAWRLPELRSGWPWLVESCLGNLLPAALSLQRLHAVAVDKGCYPGQEIVARLHFRGGHKRHLHRVSLLQAVHVGDPLQKDDREVGCVLDAIDIGTNIEALVILHDDVAAPSNDRSVLMFDRGIEMTLVSTWPA